MAALTSCAGSQVCGSGNKYLAVISFNYGSGTSFISVATAAEQAYTSGSYQARLTIDALADFWIAELGGETACAGAVRTVQALTLWLPCRPT